MRLTNEVRDIIKNKIRKIFDKQRNILQESCLLRADIEDLIVKELTKSLKTSIPKKLESFEKKHNISFVDKESIIKEVYASFNYKANFSTKEYLNVRDQIDNLNRKEKETYENLILKLSLDKDIKSLEEEFKKIEEMF